MWSCKAVTERACTCECGGIGASPPFACQSICVGMLHLGCCWCLPHVLNFASAGTLHLAWYLRILTPCWCPCLCGAGAAETAPVLWHPSRDPQLGPRGACPVQPLASLCLRVLVDFIDCVESLEARVSAAVRTHSLPGTDCHVSKHSRSDHMVSPFDPVQRCPGKL